MLIKRKSNWYIYFIAFGITLVFAFVAIVAFRWFLFPEDDTPAFVDSNGELSEDYVPTFKENFNTVVMISDNYSASPDLFILCEFNAVENRLTLIPLASGISMDSYGKDLKNIYTSQGADEVIKTISDITGITCEGYVGFNENSFKEIVQSFGNVIYKVPKTIIISDDRNAETINAGDKLFSADTLYAYIMRAEFTEGENYRFNIVGDILSELINQNYRDLNNSRLGMLFNSMTEKCTTNLTSDNFSSHKAALLYMIQNGVSPAEFYIPYGEYTSDGGFAVSDNSLITIKQKAGIY